MGADVITTIYAKLRGYTTRTYPELAVRHLRPMATADGVAAGACARARISTSSTTTRCGSSPARLSSPSASSHAGYRAGGSCVATWRRRWARPQAVADPEFRAFTRNEQRERVRRALQAGGRA